MTSTDALASIAVLASICACAGGRNTPLDGVDAAYPIDASTTVTLDRTMCFGTCPVYSLSIAADGRVSYFGRKYVKVLGAAEGRIAVLSLQQLVDLMMEADYFSLAVPECPDATATDAPTVTTSLTWAGQTHTVENYHGKGCAPPVLRTLEDQIDVTAHSSQWVKCNAGDDACDG